MVEAGFPFMLVRVLGFLSVSGLEDDEAAMLAGFDLGMYVSISVSTPVVLIIFVVQIEDAEYSIPLLLLMALYKLVKGRERFLSGKPFGSRSCAV